MFNRLSPMFVFLLLSINSQAVESVCSATAKCKYGTATCSATTDSNFAECGSTQNALFCKSNLDARGVLVEYVCCNSKGNALVLNHSEHTQNCVGY